jgi:hypothetical protein
MTEQPTSYEEIIVRYGDFWARIGPGGITIGFGGGELASFPTLEPFETLYSKVKKAWDYLNPPTTKPTPTPTKEPPKAPSPPPRPTEEKP